MEENDKVASPTFGPGNVGLNKLTHNYSLRIVIIFANCNSYLLGNSEIFLSKICSSKNNIITEYLRPS